MEYDPDDEPPPVTTSDIYWWYMNRAAEWGMYFTRLLGFKERKLEMLIRCENPACEREARNRAKFQDPRRGHGDEIAYVDRYYCCDECMLSIQEYLEQQAQYARLVH